jgi:23S rRNA (adenine2503-C2)-methyltransferase
MSIVKDIRQLSKEEINAFVVESGEKTFRTAQVWDWLWKKGAGSFDDMTDLPKKLRLALHASYSFFTLQAETTCESRDGTIKIAFRLHDQSLIEGVLIPSGQRATACVSSQTGCRLGCCFCATSKIKHARNLSAGEIFEQVQFLNGVGKEKHDLQLTNIVLMGMGEPLLNYDQVISAIRLISDPGGMNFSPQRITLSTAGIPEMIKKLAGEKIKPQLAISLHAANDRVRNRLMPVNKKHPLSELHESLYYYNSMTGKRITIEYLLLENINNSLRDADELAGFCRSFPCKINLIEYNKTNENLFLPSSPAKTASFLERLKNKNMIVLLRKSRGSDINAACGQLIGKDLYREGKK